MITTEETISNVAEFSEVVYCRSLFRDRQQTLLKFIRPSEETAWVISSDEAKEVRELALAFEQICTSLCSHIYSPAPGLRSRALVDWNTIRIEPLGGFAFDRTSPIVDILEQAWKSFPATLDMIETANQIGQFRMSALSASSSAEDLIRIELPADVKEDFQIPPISVSAEVIQFCFKNRIQDYFARVIGLIHQYFASATNINAQIEQDPETGEEWIVFAISIPGEVDEVLDKYNKYTDHFLSLVPWPASQMYRIFLDIV